MVFLQSIILGIVEGLTEFLPISSTGHLIIVNHFIANNIFTAAFKNAFEIIIQLGAILAVVYLFWDKLWPFGSRGFKSGVLLLWLKIALAVVPAAALGLLYDDTLEARFFNPQSVAAALLVYGLVLIFLENLLKRQKPRVTAVSGVGWVTALLLGFFQCLALIPGTSRSLATILGGLLLGLSRQAAAEFSFFLAVPTLFGAALLKLIKAGFAFSALEWSVLAVGFISAFLTAVIVIRLFLDYIQKHNFKLFGWYRIILALLVLWLLKQ